MRNVAAPEARILTSAAFRRARFKAARLITSPQALTGLLRGVDGKCSAYPALRSGSCGLDLDIICAVVEAHLEQRASGCIAPTPSPTGPSSITGNARLRLVVAALLYLLDVDDVIPDTRPDGMTDDMVLLRWASRMARAELPAAS